MTWVISFPDLVGSGNETKGEICVDVSGTV